MDNYKMKSKGEDIFILGTPKGDPLDLEIALMDLHTEINIDWTKPVPKIIKPF